ncbi:IS1380 family transposase [Streptantibioticus ferralitis]|uniref:IS1380 family transposase n=1 Tax=Streptantibioticus ferralitis TaxID=236510 RepID=A0ABT5ZCM0_9ACTN|nr:IS1380 family transposase [Streptantibioticus ferralitis]MDF2261591.1 IS1380 family transposase [Streptantibioticus ferralitis]
MQSSHAAGAVDAAFDEANLIADAGLVPVVRLAERTGLPRLADEAIRIAATRNGGGANPTPKVMSLVAAMCAGADSIEDADRLRHGAMPVAFHGVRAPSTLGTFLRSFTHGHVLQLHAVHRKFLAALAAHTPMVPDADQVAFIDIDSTHKQVFGRAKQGAQIGRFKAVRTLHPLLATICTPATQPVIAAVRLRQGKSADARGAPRFVTEAIATAVEADCTGVRILRADSKFYSADVVAACHRKRTHFSISTGMNPSIQRAIAGIEEEAWRPIRYPRAVVDPDTGVLISDAEVEVAEIPAYTAFVGRPKAEQVTARLIVRRVVDLAKPATVGEQGELFPVWRYHPFFTDSPHQTLQAERAHRHHAIIEQVIADGKAGPLAHLPSGHFNANAAWLTCWAISYNLLRAAGTLAGAFYAKATTATIRQRIICVPARLARSGRRLTLHLPEPWHRQAAWLHLFRAVHAPPHRA